MPNSNKSMIVDTLARVPGSRLNRLVLLELFDGGEFPLDSGGISSSNSESSFISGLIVTVRKKKY